MDSLINTMNLTNALDENLDKRVCKNDMQLTGAAIEDEIIDKSPKMIYNISEKDLKQRKELMIMNKMFYNKLEVIITFQVLTFQVLTFLGMDK